jgi:hypothetical protein
VLAERWRARRGDQGPAEPGQATSAKEK